MSTQTVLDVVRAKSPKGIMGKIKWQLPREHGLTQAEKTIEPAVGQILWDDFVKGGHEERIRMLMQAVKSLPNDPHLSHAYFANILENRADLREKVVQYLERITEISK